MVNTGSKHFAVNNHVGGKVMSGWTEKFYEGFTCYKNMLYCIYIYSILISTPTIANIPMFTLTVENSLPDMQHNIFFSFWGKSWAVFRYLYFNYDSNLQLNPI